MPFLRSLNKFADLYRFIFKNIFSLGVWWPLLLLAGCSVIVLIGLVNYTEPALYAIVNPFLKAVGSMTSVLGISPDFSEQFSHYPGHFRLLAIQFEWAKLPVALLLEGLTIMLAARAFARRSLGRTGNSDVALLPHLDFVTWMRIVFVWFVIYLLIVSIAYSLPSLFETWLYASPRRAQIFDIGLFTVTNILIAPFVYAFPLFGVGVDSKHNSPSITGALKRSVQLFRMYPFISVFIVLLPSFLLVYPLTWAVSPSAGFAAKLQPELMAYLLGGLIVGNMLVNLFYAGAAAKLILDENH
ncbi:hypothetical protein JYU19_02145 [bacterium AH-315-J21]|nr:hypothetical protein [bacterium AH-315-J21]